MPRYRSRRARGRRGKSPFNAVSLPATLLGAAVLAYFAVQLTMDPKAARGRPSTTTRPAFQQANSIPKQYTPVVPIQQVAVDESSKQNLPSPPTPVAMAQPQMDVTTQSQSQQDGTTQTMPQQEVADQSQQDNTLQTPQVPSTAPIQEQQQQDAAPTTPLPAPTFALAPPVAVPVSAESQPNPSVAVGPPPTSIATETNTSTVTATVAPVQPAPTNTVATKTEGEEKSSATEEENQATLSTVTASGSGSNVTTEASGVAAVEESASTNATDNNTQSVTEEKSGEAANAQTDSSQLDGPTNGTEEAKTEENNTEDDAKSDQVPEQSKSDGTGEDAPSVDENKQDSAAAVSDGATSTADRAISTSDGTPSNVEGTALTTEGGAPTMEGGASTTEGGNPTTEGTVSTTQGTSTNSELTTTVSDGTTQNAENGTPGDSSNTNETISTAAASSTEPDESAATNDTSTAEEGEDDSSGLSRIGHNTTHASVQVRHGNYLLRIPRGSRVTGNLPEFLGVIPATGAMIRGQNVTRVSYALFKIIQLFRFRNMIDVPCGAHVEWMSEMLQRVEFDRPMFTYMGIDTNCSVLPVAKERIGEIGQGADFACMDVLDSELPGPSDVLFYWPDIGGEHDARNEGYAQHVEAVMKNAKDRNVTYIIIPQWPRVKGRAVKYRYGRWVFEGEDDGNRPFLMNEYVRGVVPTVQNSDDPYIMYMTFYALRAITFYG